MINPNTNMQNAFKVAKRIAITILISIPFLLAFAFLTRKVITSNGLQILCFVLIMGVFVLVEELIVRAKERRKKKEAQVEEKTDVFK